MQTGRCLATSQKWYLDHRRSLVGERRIGSLDGRRVRVRVITLERLENDLLGRRVGDGADFDETWKRQGDELAVSTTESTHLFPPRIISTYLHLPTTDLD